MLADELDYVLGVDTHRDEHVLAVVTAPAGAVIAGRSAAANMRGYRELLRVADRHAPGRRAWAIEGTGSCGASRTGTGPPLTHTILRTQAWAGREPAGPRRRRPRSYREDAPNPWRP